MSFDLIFNGYIRSLWVKGFARFIGITARGSFVRICWIVLINFRGLVASSWLISFRWIWAFRRPAGFPLLFFPLYFPKTSKSNVNRATINIHDKHSCITIIISAARREIFEILCETLSNSIGFIFKAQHQSVTSSAKLI